MTIEQWMAVLSLVAATAQAARAVMSLLMV